MNLRKSQLENHLKDIVVGCLVHIHAGPYAGKDALVIGKDDVEFRRGEDLLESYELSIRAIVDGAEVMLWPEWITRINT